MNDVQVTLTRGQAEVLCRAVRAHIMHAHPSLIGDSRGTLIAACEVLEQATFPPQDKALDDVHPWKGGDRDVTKDARSDDGVGVFVLNEMEMGALLNILSAARRGGWWDMTINGFEGQLRAAMKGKRGW